MSKCSTHDELGRHLFLAKWYPALRWHEPDLGFCVELGNHHSNAKGAAQGGKTLKSLSTEVEAWDRAVSISEDAPVMGVERRGRILTWKTSRNWLSGNAESRSYA